MIIQCNYCGKSVEKETGHVNRAKKLGNGLYCNQRCSGAAKRHGKTIEQLKEEKRLYDIEYRKKNGEYRKQQMIKYNSSPAGRAMQKRNREKFKESHLEYCRTPEYRKWKREYDKKHRSKKEYGEFWESAILLNEIETIIDNRQTKQELQLINKSQKRKRAYEKAKRNEFKTSPLGNLK